MYLLFNPSWTNRPLPPDLNFYLKPCERLTSVDMMDVQLRAPLKPLEIGTILLQCTGGFVSGLLIRTQ